MHLHANAASNARPDCAVAPLVWVALAAATALKLYLALTTAGTLDVAAFADHLHKIEEYGGVGVYQVRGVFNNPFNNPPFIIHALKALGWLTATTRLPFAFWLRLPCILADVGSLLITRDLLARAQPERKLTRPLLWLALSPIAIIISGFHGNTDPVMIFFVLLAVSLIERGSRVWLAGAAFGLALNIKAVPLMFAPALLCYLPDWPRRLKFLGAAATIWFVGSLPYVLQAPGPIAQAVLGYGSLYGHWGWTFWLARWWPETLRFAHQPHDVIGPHAVYAALGKWLMLALIGATSVWLNRRARKPPLFLQCGLIVTIFLALTPGFGTQYLAWLVPWLAALALAPALAYQLLGGVYLFIDYTCWIYRAAPPGYCTPVSEWLPMNLCWGAVLVALLFYLLALCRSGGTPDIAAGGYAKLPSHRALC